MIFEILLAACILMGPVEITSTEVLFCNELISGYNDGRTIDVVDANGEHVIYINVHMYNVHSKDFNMQDGRLFFSDLALLISRTNHEGINIAAMLAQAYTEGGAGKKGVYTRSNNLFGLRAGPTWDGLVYARDLGITFVDYASAKARGAKDLFRAYYCMNDSIDDYIELIQTSDNYKKALGKDAKSYLKYLTKHGYGSTSMVKTWMSVIKLYNLKEVGK